MAGIGQLGWKDWVFLVLSVFSPRVPVVQLLLIMAVVAALAISEYAPGQPVSGLGGRMAIAGGAIAVVAGFALACSVSIARGLRSDFAKHRLLLRRFRILRRAHLVLWMIAVGGILYWLDWPQLVRFNLGLDRAFLIDDLLILAPIVVPMVLSWAAFYEVDRAVQLAISAAADRTVAEPQPQREGTGFGVQGSESRGRRGIRVLNPEPRTPNPRNTDARCAEVATKDSKSFPSRRRYLMLHVRHHLGILLVPVLGLLAVQDLVGLVAPERIDCGWGPLVMIGSLAALFLLFPVFLRYIWQTRPLPAGPLRDRLEGAARRSGVPIRDVLVWHTDGMVLNAAVAGFVRRLRYVFLSDGLMAGLTDDEIEAVFRHELGHIRHHHLPLRVMAMVAPLSLCMLLGQALPGAVGLVQQWLGDGGLGLQVEMGLLSLAAMGLYLLVVFGYFSRLLEHQADLSGCRSTGPNPPRPPVEAFASALEKLAGSSDVGRKTRSWQHASIARRIDFLFQLGLDPRRELHFHRRVRLLACLTAVVAIGPVIIGLLLGCHP